MIGYYDYTKLAAKALSESATQGDIDNLGQWFSLYGDRYWTGECFEVDGAADVNIYPVYRQSGEDIFEIDHYTLDPSEERVVQ